MLPAIAEERQTFEYTNVFGKHSKVRHEGEVLHPEREPEVILHRLKATLGEYHFAGQYQQAPAPSGGGIYKHEWIRFHEPHERPESFDQTILSWDTANQETEVADYSVCTTWGIKGKDSYLIYLRRAKMDFPTLRKAVIEQIARFQPDVVLIEDKASGTQLIQELRSLGHPVRAIKPQGDKVMRARAQTASFDSGFVWLPKQAVWLDAYVHELLTFPRGKCDDQVDSTAQAMAWMVTQADGMGLMGYYRQMAEEMRRGQG